MSDINIGWWNLENLFDSENASRPSELKSRLKRELKGWSAAVRNRKIAQLASIIEMMFDGEGPDLLGVCEVENEAIVERLANAINLPGRNYQVVAHESPDARGIDVSFIVDSNTLSATDTDHQVIVKRTPTRDLFCAKFTLNGGGPTFAAIANHWPSRTAGQYQSEPFRMLTGETLAFVIAELLYGDNGDKDTPIVVMGDFNDEPFNRSMQEYLLGTRDPGRVRFSKSGHLLNLMWPLMRGDDPGTYLFKSNWNMLDQILVSYPLVRRTGPLRVKQDSIEISRPDILKGSSGRPLRFGRPSRDSLNEDGYSDHFPVTVKLEWTDAPT